MQLVLALVAYVTQLGVGIALAVRPHNHSLVYDVAYLLVASFAVGLRRAWMLMQGAHLSASQEGLAAGQPPNLSAGTKSAVVRMYEQTNLATAG
jgi:hypothetical protein